MPYQIFCTMNILLNAPRLRDISPREFGWGTASSIPPCRWGCNHPPLRGWLQGFSQGIFIEFYLSIREIYHARRPPDRARLPQRCDQAVASYPTRPGGGRRQRSSACAPIEPRRHRPNWDIRATYYRRVKRVAPFKMLTKYRARNLPFFWMGTKPFTRRCYHDCPRAARLHQDDQAHKSYDIVTLLGISLFTLAWEFFFIGMVATQ